MARVRLPLLAFVLGAWVPGSFAACSSSSSAPASSEDSGMDTSTTDGGGDTGPMESGPSETGPETGPMPEAGHDARPESGAEGGTDARSDADAGPPQPVVLLGDAPNATFLATDGTRVYWADWVAGDAGGKNARIMSVPVGGGTESTLATITGATPTGLAIDATNAYFTASDGSLSQVPLAGGPTTPLGSGVAAPVGVANGFVFYSATGGGVSKVAVGGGTATPLASGVTPLDLVVVASNVYWADATGHIAYVPAGAGGTPTNLVTPDPDAGSGEYVSNTPLQNLTTDGTSLYWNRYPGAYPGAVMSIAVNGVAPQVVVNVGQNTPFSVATDGAGVFFVDVSSPPSIVSVPNGTTSPVTLTSTDTSAANIAGTPGPTLAVDATSVYWLNPPQIMKIAK